MQPREQRATIEQFADFSVLRYAQCWEDADVLLEALAPRPGDVCLSICSGGDNTLSLLSRGPARVIAVDLSPAQIACLELKTSAYRLLEHSELLQLVGARPGDRAALYARCRPDLSGEAREFWDAHPEELARGLGEAGKFERYIRLFRTRVLPLIHPRSRVADLFTPRSASDRQRFYREVWNSARWRALFRVFFSRRLMGRLGRDPSFFRYVEGSVAERILARAEHALATLDPADNAYLQWMALGRFSTALPHCLRPENFISIRRHLDRLEWRLASVETVLAEAASRSMDKFNMSDVFEYVSAEATEHIFHDIARVGRAGGRVAYWNMLAPRRSPPALAPRVRRNDDLSAQLHRKAKTFFYCDFAVEEIV